MFQNTPETAQICANIPKEDYVRLLDSASDSDRNLSAEIRRAIRHHLSEIEGRVVSVK
jgi:hypothetical protein